MARRAPYVVVKDMMASSTKQGGWRVRSRQSGHTLPAVYSRRTDAQAEATRLNEAWRNPFGGTR